MGLLAWDAPHWSTTFSPLQSPVDFIWSFLHNLFSASDSANGYKKTPFKKKPFFGVPVVAQWFTNLTRNHEVAGSIPGLAQWVKDPVLP